MNNPPWNKGRAVGQKKPFTPKQVKAIKRMLLKNNEIRNLALFSVGIDTMLRASDLLSLKVSDVMEGGEMKSEFFVRQNKTKSTNLLALQEQTKKILYEFIQTEQKMNNDYLFTADNNKSTPISYGHYTHLIKAWVKEIGLETKNYSSHSIRRTKSSIIYEKTKDIEVVRQLLGHKSLASTSAYLNIQQREALEIAKSIDI